MQSLPSEQYRNNLEFYNLDCSKVWKKIWHVEEQTSDNGKSFLSNSSIGFNYLISLG